MDTYNKLISSGVIAVLRGIEKDKLLPLAQAIAEGGVTNIEVTLVHHSEQTVKESLEKINMLSLSGLGLNVGAGTVLTKEQVLLAKEAGAKYIISPDAKEAVIKETKALGLVSIPGALTPCEITAAYEWGADIIKVFPCAPMGIGYFKAIKAPLAHIPMAAVGGICTENAKEFFENGACCIGVGGNLAKVNDLNSVTEYAKILCNLASYRK